MAKRSKTAKGVCVDHKTERCVCVLITKLDHKNNLIWKPFPSDPTKLGTPAGVQSLGGRIAGRNQTYLVELTYEIGYLNVAISKQALRCRGEDNPQTSRADLRQELRR
jgi:hypothetical protein